MIAKASKAHFLLDVVSPAISVCNKEDSFKGQARAFKGSEEIIFSTVKARDVEKNKLSWLAPPNFGRRHWACIPPYRSCRIACDAST